MEQNAGTNVPVAPATDNKQKSGNGLKIATTIACIVAVCGIGFGVYGMIDANSAKNSMVSKDVEISDLHNEITDLTTKIDELEKQINTQQNSLNRDNKGTTQTTLDEELTADIQNGVFLLKNSNGTIIARDDTKNISQIISCDSGTYEARVKNGSNLKCTAKTVDGQNVWFIYDFGNKELRSGYSSVNLGP